MVMDSVPAPVTRDRADAEPRRTERTTRLRPHQLSVVVLLIGLLVTAGVAATSRINYSRNEHRQVATQAQLAAAALAVAPVDVQRRLGRATTLTAATGNADLFAGAMKSSVPRPFVSVELFRMTGGSPRLVTSLGQHALLDPSSRQTRALITHAAGLGSLALTRVVTSSAQRLGYAMAVRALGRTYVAYAEQVLPADRHAEIPAGSPLADMDFALYYGTQETQDALIETNTGHLPIGGDPGRATVPFGDQTLTAVMTPRSPLLGDFAAAMPWIIAGVGVLLTAIMALLAERLARRRAVAEQLASVTEQLYRSERSVAETLQTALLPRDLPTSPELEVATRYLPGTEGIEVGGDWYDLIRLPGNRMFFTIGDVSGRGLSAATMMSRLRHSITAYAVEGNDPATVLRKVSGLVDVARDGHFATALCGIIDVGSGRVTVANAGHPPLVRITDAGTEPVATPIGAPLGVGSQYTPTEIRLPAGGVLLAYTDGLIERRDQSIDARIAYLCQVARPSRNLEGLLDTVLAALVHGASEDDTAILGLQWTR